MPRIGTPIERIDGCDARRARFGHASRPAGDDDAADARELIGGGVDRKDVALNADLAHAPREQMTVLPACVENCDAVHEGNYTSTVDSRQSSVDALMTAYCRLLLLQKRLHHLLRLRRDTAFGDRLGGHRRDLGNRAVRDSAEAAPSPRAIASGPFAGDLDQILVAPLSISSPRRTTACTRPMSLARARRRTAGR